MDEMKEQVDIAALREEFDEHYSPEEIAAAARGEIGAAHAERCARCAEDIADIRALLAPPPGRHTMRWLALAATIAAIALLALWRPSAPPATARERPEWLALKTAPLTRPEILRELRPAAGTLRDPGAQDRRFAMQPAGSVVEWDRPQFSWPPVAGARAYRVIVFAGGAQVAGSGELPAPAWQPDRPLPRGRTYEWQVIAAMPAGERILPPPGAPRALFAVLSAPALNEIATAQRERPDDHLLLGLLYARAGVLDRAAEELRGHERLRRTVAEWRE